jgi:hypothetical protein
LFSARINPTVNGIALQRTGVLHQQLMVNHEDAVREFEYGEKGNA